MALRKITIDVKPHPTPFGTCPGGTISPSLNEPDGQVLNAMTMSTAPIIEARCPTCRGVVGNDYLFTHHYFDESDSIMTVMNHFYPRKTP
jgi:hypothetical protein